MSGVDTSLASEFFQFSQQVLLDMGRGIDDLLQSELHLGEVGSEVEETGIEILLLLFQQLQPA